GGVVWRSDATGGAAWATPSASTCSWVICRLLLYHVEHVPYGTLRYAHVASPGTPARRRGPPRPRRRDRRPEPAPACRGDRHQPPNAPLPLRIPGRPAGRGHPGRRATAAGRPAGVGDQSAGRPALLGTPQRSQPVASGAAVL